MKNCEIERKWLLEGFPDLQHTKEMHVEQAYLAFEPTAVRIRMRECGDAREYWLTFKSRGTLVRKEVELPLSQQEYKNLLPLVVGEPVKKLYRTYSLPCGHTLECNLVDEGEDTSFYYAEVEFGSVEEANTFDAPGFLCKEVTEDPTFTMAAYCYRKAQAAHAKEQLLNPKD